MKFKLDENVPASVASILSQEGHDVETVYSQHLQGAEDALVAEVCRSEERILVTLDLDFANIAAYPPQRYPGILVLRPRGYSVFMVHILIRRMLTVLGTETPHGALWIIEPNRIRITNLSPPDQGA